MSVSSFIVNLTRLGLGLIVALGLSMQTVTAQDEKSFSKSDIEKIVRDYLIENPEILIEVQQAFEAKQQQRLAERQKQTLAERRDELYSGPYQVVLGNPDAEITVVEFFDYNCPFCARAIDDMHRILSTNDNVRFILKEFPVLGEGSVEATQVSMALTKIYPEKYADFHERLLSLEGQKDAQIALQLAEEMGADISKIQTEMENPEIIETIRGTYQIADSLGITGTPSYVIEDEVVFGAVGYDELQDTLNSKIAQNEGN
ncbi:MAG: DsbA family protein [Pseudomonadota bacterium]